MTRILRFFLVLLFGSVQDGASAQGRFIIATALL